MIKLLHGADFHLDSPFEALPMEKAVAQRSAQRELLDELITLATKSRVDVILLAGDILDSEKGYYETGDAIIRAFSKTKTPIFIAPGNHDYYHRRSPWAALRLPEHVHVFDKNELEAIEIPGKNLVVWGAAFTQNQSKSLLHDFTPPTQDGKTHLMVLHGDVSGTEYYNSINTQELMASGMHYIALGHKHSYSGLQKAGDVFYAYSGCIAGRGFDEQGACGVVIAEVEHHRVRERFCPLGGRQYHDIRLDISGETNIAAAILNAAPEQPENCICRITLVGETEEQVNVKLLSEQLSTQFFHLELRDYLSPRRDIWARAEEDNLRGLFLRKMRHRYENATDETERRSIVLAVRHGVRAMEQGEQLGVS